MPQLTLDPSFVEGQYHAMQILSGNTTAKPYTDNAFIEEFFREVIEVTEHKTKLSSIVDGVDIEQKMTMLDSIVKSFQTNNPEHEERVVISACWTILSQLIYTNEFMIDEYNALLREILGQLI